MNRKLQVLAEQACVILLFLISFLVLFEDKLVLPYWLQPIGRMHPLLLHFPIVLLILAVLIGLVGRNPAGENFKLYYNLAGGFLLFGILLSGITIIMGLFLSREEGYSGETLAWHKWSGIIVFYLGCIIYRMRTWSRNSTGVAWVSAVTLPAILLLTGHYGAELSHGEDFILEPIIANRKASEVPVEEAIVYDHIIQPILDRKCAGCHNPGKLKGQLALTDSLGLLKGGKSGRLFVPGDPGTSLLLERVHLSLEEKKHMPPAGKPQLTDAEISLLTTWIRQNAEFGRKLVSLDETDSLRILATAYLQPAGSTGEQFDFPAADAKTIQKLNSFDRTVAQLARESPALDVSLFNRNTYTQKQLQELTPIKEQVVSVNLNKLPVKDDDIKSLQQFINLRRLDVNFTDISDKALPLLGQLPELKTLSIAGTKVTFSGLKENLGSYKKLQTITVWNTGLSPDDLATLRKTFNTVQFIEGFRDDGKDSLKLNPPQVKNALMVFSSNLDVQLRHPVKGVEIRYTLDGSEPDSIRSPVFDGHTKISKHTTVKAKAFKPGWLSSDIVSFDYLKNSFVPDSVRILFPLNPVHQAEGAETFFNKRLGVIGANNPAWANNWAGARDNDMGLVALFKEPVMLSSVGLHYMLETETGIFPPGAVEVWGGADENSAKLLLTIRPPEPPKGGKARLGMLEGSFRPHAVSYLKILVKPHRANKDHHLLLIDEMFLN